MGRLLKVVLTGATALGALAPAAQAAVDFDAPVGYAADAPAAITSGDFNADGIIDLATAGGSNATVLLGVGDGSFRATPPFTVDMPATGIAAGRLNGDGFDDLVTSQGTSGATGDDLDRFLSNGDGTFGGDQDFPSGIDPEDVALGQLDADNFSDAAVAHDGAVSVHRGNGTGGFMPPTIVALGGPNARAVAIGDLDGDGDNDLAIAASNNVYAAINDGAGAFTVSAGLVGAAASAVTIVDTDRNGRGDVVAVKAGGNLAVVRSSGSEPDGFEASFDQEAGGNASAVEGRDLDADGIPDLVVSNSNGEMTALIGRGDGRFDPTEGFPASGNPRDVVTGDFNRDGNPDAAVASESADRVFVFISRAPQLSFTPPVIDFPDREPGTSETRAFRLTNNGPPRAHIVDVTIAGGPDFTIVSNNCDGANLGIGQSCDVGVRFAPTGNGRFDGRLVVRTSNAGGPHTIGLGGSGATPAPKPGPCANPLNGTAAAETLTGGAAGDNIFGFGGADTLNGLGERDCLLGGTGNDRLNGGEGNDSLEGSRGNDVADGGNGRDRASGGSGRDKLSGGTGNDTLNGGSSHDRLSGGSGNDRLNGSTGNDRITGGSGKNSYNGGPGRDNITAANGRVERVDCGTGRDKVRADRKDRLKRCERVRRTRR